MKVLLGQRSEGITTDLIYESFKTNMPIVVLNRSKKDLIIKKAKILGLEIPDPIIITDSNIKGRKFNGIIIDDFRFVLTELIRRSGLDFGYIHMVGNSDGYKEG